MVLRRNSLAPPEKITVLIFSFNFSQLRSVQLHCSHIQTSNKKHRTHSCSVRSYPLLWNSIFFSNVFTNYDGTVVSVCYCYILLHIVTYCYIFKYCNQALWQFTGFCAWLNCSLVYTVCSLNNAFLTVHSSKVSIVTIVTRWQKQLNSL